MSFSAAPLLCFLPLFTSPWPGIGQTQEGRKTFSGHKHFIILKLGYSERVGPRGGLDRQASSCAAYPPHRGPLCFFPLTLPVPAQQGPKKEPSKFQGQTWLPPLLQGLHSYGTGKPVDQSKGCKDPVWEHCCLNIKQGCLVSKKGDPLMLPGP